MGWWSPLSPRTTKEEVEPLESRIKKKKNKRRITQTKIYKGCSLPSQCEGSQFLFVCHFLCGNDFLMSGEGGGGVSSVKFFGSSL